ASSLARCCTSMRIVALCFQSSVIIKQGRYPGILMNWHFLTSYLPATIESTSAKGQLRSGPLRQSFILAESNITTRSDFAACAFLVLRCGINGWTVVASTPGARVVQWIFAEANCPGWPPGFTASIVSEVAVQA